MRIDSSVRQISPDPHDRDVRRLKEIFEWTISGFGNIPEKPGESVHSSIISANHDGKDKWYLELYPCGRDQGCKDYFSLYLILKSTKRMEIRLRYELSIRNSRTNEKIVKKESMTDFVNGKSSGWRHFVPREKILSREDDFLKNDELRVYCEFNYDINSMDESTKMPNDAPASSSCGLVKDLWNFVKKSEFCDVVCVVGDKTYRAHKNVLAARSKKFRAKLNPKEEHTYPQTDGVHRLEIDNMEPHVFEKLLKFIYTGDINKAEGIADSLLAAAHEYELNDLKTICENILGEQLNIRNAVDTLVMADEFEARELKADVLKFINGHLVGVVESEGWGKMEKEHPGLVADLVRAQVAEKRMKKVTFKDDVVFS